MMDLWSILLMAIYLRTNSIHMAYTEHQYSRFCFEHKMSSLLSSLSTFRPSHGASLSRRAGRGVHGLGTNSSHYILTVMCVNFRGIQPIFESHSRALWAFRSWRCFEGYQSRQGTWNPRSFNIKDNQEPKECLRYHVSGWGRELRWTSSGRNWAGSWYELLEKGRAPKIPCYLIDVNSTQFDIEIEARVLVNLHYSLYEYKVSPFLR